MRFKEPRDKTPGKGGLYGTANKKTGAVEVDPRQDEHETLDTLVHEMLHVLAPGMSEKTVAYTSTRIANQLWKLGYRRQ